MSVAAKAKPAAVGAFVLLALGLGIGLILFLGKGTGSGHPIDLVVYFESDIKGLNIGAPVTLKGVQVGSVRDIQVQLDAEEGRFRLPVSIRLDLDKIAVLDGARAIDDRKMLDHLIQRGLRAELAMQSLLTGLLLVQLDFHPDSPLRLVGGNQELQEIPSISSGLERFTKRLSSLPIDRYAEKLDNVLVGLDRIINGEELARILANISAATGKVDELLAPLGPRLDSTLAQLGNLASEAEELSRTLRSQLVDLGPAATSTLEQATTSLQRLDTLLGSFEDTLGQARSAMTSVTGAFDQDSALYHEMLDSLREVTAAARSLRIMADYLERHPEALLRGKGVSP